MTPVSGLHHVSAIASDPQRTLDFYLGVLGLRLVKRTVNFDDPQTYHFYFGDAQGQPGSLLTFFPWPGAHRGRHGSGQIAVTSLSVPPSSLGFWIERLLRHGIRYEGPSKRQMDGGVEKLLSFADPDGLMLELVGHPDAAEVSPWDGIPDIPEENAIRGLHSVTLWVNEGEATEQVLTGVLGFRELAEDASTRRYGVGDALPGQLVNLRSIGGFGEARGGAGTVHHVAFGVADDAEQSGLRNDILAGGLHPTGVLDRKYFQSVYFREPGGVLFELATLGPGFGVDESADQLGSHLTLPGALEPERATIEANLPPIHLPSSSRGLSVFEQTTGPEDVSGDALGYIHKYVPPPAGPALAGGTTLLLLHGTGGDENDLMPLGRALLPGAGLLGVRGNVSERGAARFFRRIAEGVFDQEDLSRRTAELADFIASASRAYHLDGDRIIAVGFSNGANIAASLLLREANVLRRAILFSPMMPFEPERLPVLEGTAVFIAAGRNDPIVPAEQVTRLSDALEKAGARVTLHWEQGGHTIARSAVEAAAAWIAA
ncbi:MAG TPA: VOC family protein [Gemmatimonadales bacterium]|nr:VOC family protein [Gemmatimonadales bacterium]